VREEELLGRGSGFCVFCKVVVEGSHTNYFNISKFKLLYKNLFKEKIIK